MIGAAENASAIAALRLGLAQKPEDRPQDAVAFGRLLEAASAVA
jgi:hypothetical protein